MSALVSRILVIVVGLPVVLELIWLGGWWLFVLAVGAALLALHEFFWMTRPLRPLVLAGYGGAALAILGAELGGAGWMGAGFPGTLPPAFPLQGVAQRPQSATGAGGT